MKTLKDILEKNGIDFESGDWGESMVELREEAIKIIKTEIKQKLKIENHWNRNSYDGRIQLIKHLFNIKEDELK